MTARVLQTIGTGKGCPPMAARGTALVMSLVILVILTILGITAMGTSTLEERMAGSMQEATRAFEAAESGVNSALSAAGGLSLNKLCANNDYVSLPPFSYGSGGQSGSATVKPCFIQYSPPKRGSGYSAKDRAANFSIASAGRAAAGAQVSLDQGIGQIMAGQ